jgi:hypothetical protein
MVNAAGHCRSKDPGERQSFAFYISVLLKPGNGINTVDRQLFTCGIHAIGWWKAARTFFTMAFVFFTMTIVFFTRAIVFFTRAFVFFTMAFVFFKGRPAWLKKPFVINAKGRALVAKGRRLF